VNQCVLASFHQKVGKLSNVLFWYVEIVFLPALFIAMNFMSSQNFSKQSFTFHLKENQNYHTITLQAPRSSPHIIDAKWHMSFFAIKSELLLI